MLFIIFLSMNKFSFCAFLCTACFLIACGDGLSKDKSSSGAKSKSNSPDKIVASSSASVSSIAQKTVDPSTVTKGSIKDSRDGQSYKTVTIGSQTWMAKNLNYKTANSSCFRDKVSNCNKFGRLYTWDAATVACPSGWHLPTKAEYETLFAAVGGESTAGIKLKSTSGWRNGDNGTGEYSFSALPAVYKSFNEGFFAFFWSSTEYSDDEAYYMKLFYDYDGVFLYNDDKSVLKSVRCVKD
ncbi:MAG: fibrobacter succinogenes major paralogous domain-containing protein [Fibrobacter sp.]|nr:fibrobacter succinogenes major paralogous domain-containing protein [Fibrobacter sp.]